MKLDNMELKFASRMKTYEEGIFSILNDMRMSRLMAGLKVYDFWVGTPDFQPSEKILKTVSEACMNPSNYRYALTDLPELVDAVIRRYQERYHVLLETNEIMSVNGTQEGIAHIGLSICDPGDVVLIPNPGYPIFEMGATLAGALVHCYDLTEENNYLPDLNGMDDKFLEKVKMMIVSYPLNPIGKTASKEFYEDLIPWAKKHQIMIIHDNAYSDIVFDGRIGDSILSISGAKENCVEFYSLSKSYNYTGARTSFLVGNAEIISNFRKLRSQIDYGMFLPVQYGAVTALNELDQEVKEQCKVYQQRRDALCGGLRNIGWEIPNSEGTMFVWGKIPSKYTDDMAFVKELFKKTGVLCTPGSSFGSLGRGYVRFALTLSVEQILEAIEEINRNKIV